MVTFMPPVYWPFPITQYPLNLGNHHSIFCHEDLTIFQINISGFMRYFPFCYISLSIMSLHYIHIVQQWRIYFFIKDEYNPTVCTHIFCAHSSIDRYLRCFHILAMNCAVMNIETLTFSFIGKYWLKCFWISTQ